MTTTAVFAEIIVIGLEAEAWIAALVVAVFGTDWIDLSAVSAWAALITVLALAASYALGILVDRVADSALKGVAKRIQAHRPRGEAKSAGGFKRKRITVLLHGAEGVTKFLEYQRSRQRVARGTIVNLAFAIPSVLALLHWRADASPYWLVGVALVGVLLLAASVYANERILKAYEENLEMAYHLIRE